MNPDEPCWMSLCLGLDQEQTDVENVGMHVEIPDNS